jgi:agmatinase
MNLENFNPNDAAGADTGIFGLPHTAEEAAIILIPVIWEATVSYKAGTATGPYAINTASMQVDLCHHDYPELWKAGIWMDKFPDDLVELSEHSRDAAIVILDAIEEDEELNTPEYDALYQRIKQNAEKINAWVKDRAAHWKAKGKIVGLVGGDHSTPLGFYQYLNEHEEDFGILTIDAHMDLRKAFEGFEYSHASIFYNTLKLPKVSKMVQVGIRDYCHEELEMVRNNEERIKIFFDRDMKAQQYKGASWDSIVQSIIAELPQRLYISVDIDGLDPHNCPNTGTPVPGGLQYEEAIYLLNKIRESGKEIIGFDLCEVSDSENEWDANVGARMLYQLCGTAIYGQASEQ